MILEAINSLSSKIFTKQQELDFSFQRTQTISILAQKILINLGLLIASIPLFFVLAPIGLFIPAPSVWKVVAILAIHIQNECLNIHFGFKHCFSKATPEEITARINSDDDALKNCNSIILESVT